MPQRLAILLSACLAALSMPLCFTGPALALRAIHQDLGGGPAALNWVTNAFMLAFGACLMAMGALADAHGRRRVFLCGLVVFVLASLAWTVAPGIASFNVLRGLQGLGAAAALAGGGAALAQAFDGPARTRAFSLLGTTFGVGLAFGPFLAGQLMEQAGWRSFGLLLALVGGLAAGLACWCMPESRDPQAAGLDLRGAATFTGALGLFTLAVLQAPAWGSAGGATLACFAASALLLYGFVRTQQQAARPMLDLSLFRYPRFVGVQCLAAAPAYAYVVLLVLLPLRLVGIEGVSAADAGRALMALSAPMLLLPLLAAYLTRWFSAGGLCGSGLLVCAAGLLWLGYCPPGTTGLALALPLLLIGSGISLPWGLMDGLAVSVVPRERAGMATGIFGTVRVTGEGLALALVGAVLTILIAHGLALAAPGVAEDSVSQAAQSLATGGLEQALALLPGLRAETLLQVYGTAFQHLLFGLAAVTLLTAAVVFTFLRETPTPCVPAVPAKT
ncbi:MAG: MFS transporter [Burkholderiales bacterium]|nr:MFS transporter [Burkholderiales bacterium]